MAETRKVIVFSIHSCYHASHNRHTMNLQEKEFLSTTNDCNDVNHDQTKNEHPATHRLTILIVYQRLFLIHNYSIRVVCEAAFVSHRATSFSKFPVFPSNLISSTSFTNEEKLLYYLLNKLCCDGCPIRSKNMIVSFKM